MLDDLLILLAMHRIWLVVGMCTGPLLRCVDPTRILLLGYRLSCLPGLFVVSANSSLWVLRVCRICMLLLLLLLLRLERLI